MWYRLIQIINSNLNGFVIEYKGGTEFTLHEGDDYVECTVASFTGDTKRAT